MPKPKPPTPPTVADRVNKVISAAAERISNASGVQPLRITVPPHPDRNIRLGSNILMFRPRGSLECWTQDLEKEGRLAGFIWMDSPGRGEAAAAKFIRDHNFTPEVWAYVAFAELVLPRNAYKWNLPHYWKLPSHDIHVAMLEGTEYGFPWHHACTTLLPGSWPQFRPFSELEWHYYLDELISAMLLFMFNDWRLVWLNPPDDKRED